MNTIDASNDNSVEARITATLRAVADRTDPAPDWDRVRRDSARTPSTTRGRERLALVAAVALLAVGGAGIALARPSVSTGTIGPTQSTASFVLPGEQVVSENPLVVMAASGPEPRFDTAALGSEVAIQPITVDRVDLDAVIDSAVNLVTETRSGQGEVRKVTVVGAMDGQPILIVVIDGPNLDGVNGAGVDDNLRASWLVTPYGASGGGDLVEETSLELIEPARPDGDVTDEPGYDYPDGPVWWDRLPATVSVVALTVHTGSADGNDDGTELKETLSWQRVRGGVFVVPVDLARSDRFTVEALDADGEVVRTATVVTGD